jgi:type IV secretion system protein VirB1
MDFSAFMALAEGCLPGVDIRPLIEIVRAASGFEPLALTINDRKPIKILATSKDEAIALAMQARVGGQEVRLGVAGLTFGELDSTGTGVVDAFEPCPSLRAAAEILSDDPKHFSGGRAAAVLGSAATKHPVDSEFTRREERPASQETASPTETRETPRNQWDVFGGGSGKSLLVYESSPSPR